MADLNDLTKPDLQSSYANGDVPDTLLGHIKRLWLGDYTGMANLVPGMMRWAVTGTSTLAARLYRRNSLGLDVEITSLPGVSIGGNAATVTNPFPVGTRMPFAQSSAPTGWTQDVSDNADNRMLRVVNTAGGGVAGTHSPVLNSVVPSHTHGFTTGTVSSDHSHYVSGSTSSSGSHSHATSIPKVGGDGATFGVVPLAQYGTASYTSSDAGSHSHSFGAQTGGISANHTHSGSTDNGSSQTNWQPRYIDLIICTKN
jgi:hypothetical protein